MAQLLIATDAVKERRYAAAVTDLEKLGTDTFGGITGSILRAWALIGDNKIDEGLAVIDELGLDGLEEFLVFHKALMLDVAGRPDEAIDAAARAYEADPQVAWVVEAYVRMLGNAGRFDEAEEGPRRVRQRRPHPSAGRRGQARDRRRASAPASSPKTSRSARPRCSTASAWRSPAMAASTSR